MRKALLTVLLIAALTVSGCGLFQPETERNPTNDTPERPQPNPVPSRLAPQGNTAEALPIPDEARARAVLADTYAAEAESVRGVRDAVAIIDGATAVVGVRLGDGELTPALTEEIRRQLMQYDSRLADVEVTADSRLVNEIDRLNGSMRRGTPLIEIQAEIRSLRQRIEQEDG